ncbi:hypothetical protein AB6805_08330 [Chitinophaga sp. RCC_12]|uniref:hypothetical protein n=1 Tax=Chitinophaga sp. RCC_12 TaxID=3239226 RepID=UPI003526B601
MNINGLWDKLEPRPETIDIVRMDLKEGKVPELPFFIIDQNEVKAALADKLRDIDGERMQTNLIIGQYGNGKTNLLKYLQLFFEENVGPKVIYSRADIEQPDIVLFLLKIIQDHATPLLEQSISKLHGQGVNYSDLANQYRDDFSGIREYTEKLFSSEIVGSSEDLRRLIYLGTGRLYTKGHYTHFGLQQLQSFNKREVLVLFLNILAASGNYFIFAIDEVEKIQEKSKLRFNRFLTSYRELIDLFNKIKGHLLITCLTDAAGTKIIQEANEAFFTRIQPDIKSLPVISENADLLELITYLNDFFSAGKEDALGPMVIQLEKKRHQRNRDLLRNAIELLLNETETISLQELLTREQGLKAIFEETRSRLELEGAFKSLHQKFFDPLNYYLEANFGEVKLDRRDNQSFIDLRNNKTHFFLFNEEQDIDGINRKLNTLIGKYENDVIIYAPFKLELRKSSIRLSSDIYQIEIIDYDPEELFIMLNIYKDNFEYQEQVSKLIATYTKNNL